LNLCYIYSDIYLANRERALVHSMLSAGVTYAVSRACKQGLLKSCTCSRTARPKNLPRDWSWGGCGDNIDTPEKEIGPIVQYHPSSMNTNGTFYEGRRRKIVRRGRIRRQMNLHNNEVGRRVSFVNNYLSLSKNIFQRLFIA
jgi:wingless-type MMTV integration site family protein 5